MADASPQDSPSAQDSLFGSSRRTSAQTDGPGVANSEPRPVDVVMQPITAVLAKEDDREPTEEELKRNRDRFEVELEVGSLWPLCLYSC